VCQCFPWHLRVAAASVSIASGWCRRFNLLRGCKSKCRVQACMIEDGGEGAQDNNAKRSRFAKCAWLKEWSNPRLSATTLQSITAIQHCSQRHPSNPFASVTIRSRRRQSAVTALALPSARMGFQRARSIVGGKGRPRLQR
jgi:hypothetical protein